MMNKIEKAQKEVSDNYVFFQTQIAQLKKDHFKKFALLHNKEIIDFFVDEDDAIKIGMQRYGEGNFSIQQVADKSIELGYQSYVLI